MLSSFKRVTQCRALVRNCSSGDYFPGASREELIAKARDLLRHKGDGELKLERCDSSGIATLTLRHSEKKNALSGRMMVQLSEVVSELEDWKKGKGLILTGEGDFFCSGGDLSTVKAISSHEEGYLMCTFMHDTLTRLKDMHLISVSLVNGRAIGGGAELITSTDFRLFTPMGAASFVQGAMGLTPGWGGGTRLMNIIGYQRSLDLLLSGRKVDADIALDIGLADGVVDSANSLKNALAWMRERVKYEPEVLQAIKKLCSSARESEVGESLKVERDLFAPLWAGPANLKAINRNMKH